MSRLQHWTRIVGRCFRSFFCREKTSEATETFVMLGIYASTGPSLTPSSNGTPTASSSFLSQTT